MSMRMKEKDRRERKEGITKGKEEEESTRKN